MNTSSPQAEPTVEQLFDLTGRVALVTGGCGHLGSAMCRALAEAGATVIVGSREPTRAEAFAKTLAQSAGATHHGVALDHMQSDLLAAGFRQAVNIAGAVDILVNNGHESLAADWKRVTHEEFSRQLANAAGYFTLARLARDRAVERQAPLSIIMVGSMYGVVGSYPDVYEGVSSASPVAYQTLKGGILQMTRHLAVTWAGDGVRVNSLSPGPFPGPQAPAELVERLKQKIPLRRMGVPHELKGAVVFLASDAGSYVTGHNLMVDGGWTAW